RAVHGRTPRDHRNDAPQLGHGYPTVAADFLARYHRLRGDDVLFLTGTDEHGQKIQRTAQESGTDPKDFVDRMEPRWREVWERLEISYDDYIRTTEPRHAAAVSALLTAVHENGRDDIYLVIYEGLYCVSCAAYYTEDALIAGIGLINQRPME